MDAGRRGVVFYGILPSQNAQTHYGVRDLRPIYVGTKPEELEILPHDQLVHNQNL